MITIDRLLKQHLVQVAQHSQSIGWPHTLEDWASAMKLGYGFVAIEGRTVIGTMSWWPFGPDYATLGLAVVAPSHQRQGVGRSLMNAVLADVGARTVMLTATNAGRKLYETAGFESIGRLNQHQGHISAAQSHKECAAAGEPSARLPDKSDIYALDRSVTGVDRTGLINSLLATGEPLGYFDADDCIGYSICRPFGLGYVVGPVIVSSTADNPNKTAQDLLKPWLRLHGDDFVRVDTPADSGLSDWLTNHGLPMVGEGLIMRRSGIGEGSASLAQLNYALASQALG